MAVSVERLLWASYGFTFSQNLKEIRRRRGLAQQALAEISGISRTQICNLERNENNSGSSADPALSTVYKLALALEVPPSLLLPESGQIVVSICTTPRTRSALNRIQRQKAAEQSAAEFMDSPDPLVARTISTQAALDFEEPLIMTIDDLARFPRDYVEQKRREAVIERKKNTRALA